MQDDIKAGAVLSGSAAVGRPAGPESDLDQAFRLQVRRTLFFYSTTVLAVAAVSYLYQAVLGALLISLLLVYLLQPLVDRVVIRGIRRPLANILVIGSLLTVLLVGVASLLPVLYNQALVLAKLIPSALRSLSVEGQVRFRELLKYLPVDPALFGGDWAEYVSLSSHLREYLSQSLQSVINAGSLLFSSLLTAALIPVFTLTLLSHMPKIRAEMTKLTPPSLVGRQAEFFAKVDRTMRAVIQGQILVALTLGVLYMMGFSLIGVDTGLVIGLICGVCRIIPYLDIFAGIVLCAISIATHFAGWPQAVGVIVVIALVQAIDGVLITPKILGGRVGLHPVVVLASILSFGSLFGMVGVLLAIPVVALSKVVFEQFLPVYLRFIRHVG